MSFWCFCANASYTLISSHCFCLLSFLSASHLSSFLCYMVSEAESHGFFNLVKDTEGHGVPLLACDLGCLSYGNKIVFRENKPASADAKEDTICCSVI